MRTRARVGNNDRLEGISLLPIEDQKSLEKRNIIRYGVHVLS